ncbi:hypothetical protein LCGC14_1565370 [marine sediment metagenome]|uniref:Peptidase C39-like domain-containing protein n=1 Tax=marine sediment metagenome TaxID=412755 RepID=A0A0F9L256_9ZZZZ
MDKKRILLNVKRWKQRPSECSIAVCASIAAFYEKDIEYSEVRKLVPLRRRKTGLWSSEQARLLNKLGYSKVTIITADLDYVDFGWASLDKEGLLKKLKRKRTYCGRAREKELKRFVNDVIRWLSDEDYDNQLKIDQDFTKWIKMYLDHGRPVGAGFNWNSLHKYSKKGPKAPEGDIKGESELHSVVIRGYDDNGVFIVDSHTKYYKGKWEKYRNGYYKVSWHRFLSTALAGDLILVG